MACTNLDDMIDKFTGFTEKPVKFLTAQSDLKEDIKTLVKSLYDYTKLQEKVDKKEKKGALRELIVQDFDEEQVWQQIELQNTECWDQLVWEVSSCISVKNDLIFPVTTSKAKANDTDDISQKSRPDDENPLSENSMSDNEHQELEDEEEVHIEKPKKTKASKSKVKSSIVDDKFFKLQEMEKFLITEEKKEGKESKVDSDSEGSIDMFEDIDDEDFGDEEGGKEAMYNNFFDNGDDDNGVDDENDYDSNENDNDNEGNNGITEETLNKADKKVRFAVENDSSSDDDSDHIEVPASHKQSNEKKSEFELRQERLKRQIDNLEQKTLSDAPWQLKGEVDATKRPQNSLLEEVVDFDLTSRPPPIITEQTTVTLEDIIRRRIKDKAWDDVVKKEKPVDDQLSFRKTEILDQSKSKLSLAQVYEAEYLKQKQALSGETEEEKEPEIHTEIRNTMNDLFAKLDALCHYHYTPRAPQADVKIVSNTPAISMEEVAPVATSDATLLAPEEVKKKSKGELMSKEERTQTDKNRERRKKKKFQREKGGKVQKVTAHRNTTKGVEADDKSLKTSKAFFQQLNDESRSLIKKRNFKNKGQ